MVSYESAERLQLRRGAPSGDEKAVPSHSFHVTMSLRFAPGHFYGGTRLFFSSHQITVTHRIADRSEDEVESHTHTDAHFVLVTGGDYVSTAEGHPSKESPILLYNPAGTTHRDHFERGRGSFFAISVESEKTAELLAGCRVPAGPVHLVAPRQHALAIRIAAFSAFQTGGSSLDALVHELLGSMDPLARQSPRAPPAWLHRALDLLHDRYAEDLSMAEIAATVGVHPIHLARTFRCHFRCTPGDFGRFRRLEMAAHLLTRSSRTLVEVALKCGFADQSHFSKIFSRSLGLPPGEYRRLVGARTHRMFRIDKSEPPTLGKLRVLGATARQYARKHR